jgi:hypothetical protein
LSKYAEVASTEVIKPALFDGYRPKSLLVFASNKKTPAAKPSSDPPV